MALGNNNEACKLLIRKYWAARGYVVKTYIRQVTAPGISAYSVGLPPGCTPVTLAQLYDEAKDAQPRAKAA